MKKHILFIVENNSVPGDVRVWAEARSALEFGYDVTVICPSSRGKIFEYEQIEGISIYRHWRPVQGNGKLSLIVEYLNAFIWEILLSLWAFFKKPFHCIHAANPPDHIFMIALPYKVVGVKYIFDHHDICPENYIAKFSRTDLFYKMLRVMEFLTFKTADIVISTNESYRKIAKARGGKKSEDVFVVRNGPDLSNLIFMKSNARLKSGFEYLVAYVGVIGNQEGLENLLKAIEYIVYQKHIRNIKFVVIGKGPHRDHIIHMAEEMNLTNFIQFTGFIPYRDLYEFLATADLCVNPEFKNSFTDQSTMIKLMDYMVFGKPIVQFQTTEGMVTAGDAALNIGDNDIISFAEGILKLLNDPKAREKMGDLGKQRIFEELHWGIQKLNLRKAYQYLENSG